MGTLHDELIKWANEPLVIRVNGVDHILPEHYEKYVVNKNARKKIMLYVLQGGLCHWCGKKTLLPDEAGYLKPSGGVSGKAATLDHLHSRLDPKRVEKLEDGSHRYVMACSTCNGKRSLVECTQTFKEEHERRAKDNDPNRNPLARLET